MLFTPLRDAGGAPCWRVRADGQRCTFTRIDPSAKAWTVTVALSATKRAAGPSTPCDDIRVAVSSASRSARAARSSSLSRIGSGESSENAVRTAVPSPAGSRRNGGTSTNRPYRASFVCRWARTRDPAVPTPRRLGAMRNPAAMAVRRVRRLGRRRDLTVTRVRSGPGSSPSLPAVLGQARRGRDRAARHRGG